MRDRSVRKVRRGYDLVTNSAPAPAPVRERRHGQICVKAEHLDRLVVKPATAVRPEPSERLDPCLHPLFAEAPPSPQVRWCSPDSSPPRSRPSRLAPRSIPPPAGCSARPTPLPTRTEPE